MKMAQRLGIIIFGATGYTGKVVVEKIVTLAQKKNLSWGIAGRSKAKLHNLLNDVSKQKGWCKDYLECDLSLKFCRSSIERCESNCCQR
jgi:short subunit dehydrogenase-like uncharacterized protein